MTECDPLKNPIYPINTLRRLAINNICTSHFVNLDMDLWPSCPFSRQLSWLVRLYESLQRIDAATAKMVSGEWDVFTGPITDNQGNVVIAEGETVHHVAVGGGACADEWKSAWDAGCDTFVTSDAKYNDFWDARDAGLTLIDAGHFYTENPVCPWLQRILQTAFPETTVLLSKVHRDCMKFF